MIMIIAVPFRRGGGEGPQGSPAARGLLAGRVGTDHRGTMCIPAPAIADHDVMSIAAFFSYMLLLFKSRVCFNVIVCQLGRQITLKQGLLPRILTIPPTTAAAATTTTTTTAATVPTVIVREYSMT